MSYLLKYTGDKVVGRIQLPASKSESNRLLIIHALCNDNFTIKNISESNDTKSLQEALQLIKAKSANVVDVGDAGTSFRFLTALLSITEGTWFLKGSSRMHQRPIKPLVEALKQIGADIEYLESVGFPPLKIIGKKLEGGTVNITGAISSQFISALLLIAPALKDGLSITINEGIVSESYFKMTTEMMNLFGVRVQRKENTLVVNSGKYRTHLLDRDENNISFYTVESDWSAASYWYSVAALCKECTLTLVGLKKDSWQGDAAVASIYRHFGVHTIYELQEIVLQKHMSDTNLVEFDFINCPDLAQTVSVTAAFTTNSFLLNGLQTLRNKETDRLTALKNELIKLNVNVGIIDNSLRIDSRKPEIAELVSIHVYDDHRMAMSFAVLVFVMGSIRIENPEVVKKSYPNFWIDLRSVGVEIIPNE
ncbi:MAG: 3-phosphoshikimate 1-carboxyvinyltransferase [Bacteroidetes bacterium]|nr:3-phosphoshikimate 1-carboxyvinyltransferase [Bacteroidota bacterium]